MRHIFIVNPVSGKEDISLRIGEEINQVCAAHNIEPLVFISEHAGYEREMTEKICSLFPEDELRFYAVGGSGTLSNIVSGIKDFSRTEVACYPAGLTNDFLKSYGGSAEFFRSVESLVTGRVDMIDVVDMGSYRVLDFASFGLGNTCFNEWLLFKLLRSIRSYLNYHLSVVFDLLRNKCAKYDIEIDGKDYSGEYAMVVCFNGMCMGGSVIPLKDPRPNDGVLNFILADKMSRFQQIRIMKDFSRGRLEGHGDVFQIIKGREMVVSRSDRQPVVFNSDGECVRRVTTTLKLNSEKLRFVVPKDARILMPSNVDEAKLSAPSKKK